MDERAPLRPGQIVAETYEIDRLLGRGGGGEVWLATHRRIWGKQVAVKVLKREGEISKEAHARFRREAEIAAGLEHPNIVHVFDFNCLPSGEPFLVMEMLKGETLGARQRRTQGGLSLEFVRHVMRQVGAALQVAHEAGVVHRDLKPENIFLVPTTLGDQVKVLDFGISKLVDSGSVQTAERVVMGTPQYMSPEQALGRNDAITAQSDLFSLGAICYELLAGESPFGIVDNYLSTMFRVVNEKQLPLDRFRSDLPASVVAAVEHALEKEMGHRTPDIGTFVAELTGTSLNEGHPDAGASSLAPVPVVEQETVKAPLRAPIEPAVRVSVEEAVQGVAAHEPRRRGMSVAVVIGVLAALAGVGALWGLQSPLVGTKAAFAGTGALSAQGGSQRQPEELAVATGVGGFDRSSVGDARPPEAAKWGATTTTVAVEASERNGSGQQQQAPRGMGAHLDGRPEVGSARGEVSKPAKPSTEEVLVRPDGNRSTQSGRALSQAELLEVVHRNRASLAECARKHHEREPRTSGTLNLRWAIQPDGKVSDAEVVEAEFKDTFMATCAVAALWPQFGVGASRWPMGARRA